MSIILVTTGTHRLEARSGLSCGQARSLSRTFRNGLKNNRKYFLTTRPRAAVLNVRRSTGPMAQNINAVFNIAHSKEPADLLCCALFGRDCKLTSDAQMRSASMEIPNPPVCIAPGPQNFEDSPARRNQSSHFSGLAIWHKDYAVLPVQILDTHPEEFLFFPSFPCRASR